MSLLVTVAIVTSSVATAFVTQRWWRKRASVAERHDPVSKAEEWAFPVALGDVILLRGEELWIQAAEVFYEAEAPVAFVGHAGNATLVVVQRPGECLVVLSEAFEELGSNELPSSLELGGARFQRRWRLPGACADAGVEARRVSAEATHVLAEYRGAVEVAVAIAGPRGTRLWRGHQVQEGELDWWGRVPG